MTLLPPHHAPHAARYRAQGWWLAGSVPDAIGAAARAEPRRVALVDAQGALTYAEFDAAVRRVAAGLIALGLAPGEVLALQLPNRREFAIFQQAAARIGVVYQPLLPQLRALDLEYLLGASKAAAIVIPAVHRQFDHRAMLAELRDKLPQLRHVFVAGAADAPDVAVDDFLARDWEAQHGAAVEAMQVDVDAPRAITFTSGTESKPKGIVHSWNTQSYPLRTHRAFFGLGPRDAIFTPSPVGHSTGAVFGVELGLLIGGKVVLMDGWNPEQAIETIARERCTLMWGATTFFSDLVDARNVANHDVSCMRLASSAGAPIPRELVRRVRECFGGHLVSAYGQSEGGNVAITHLDDPDDKIVNSDGRFNPGVEWKLTDAERNASPAGQPGELAYRGPNVSLGYLEPKHNARAFDGAGYLYSGDLATVDRDGFLRIVGRKKDIIIRGGENISPAEIEDQLYRHPDIRKVAVIGLPDARLGQRACAVVIARPGRKPTLEDITRFLAQQKMTRFKFPECLVIVDELPVTASGKVRKDVLREEILKNMENIECNHTQRGDRGDAESAEKAKAR